MIKGVTEKEENIIKDILSKDPYDFYYYGSRVKGDFTIASDLDILTDKISYSELDVLDPSVMSGTGTPESGGMQFNELMG